MLCLVERNKLMTQIKTIRDGVYGQNTKISDGNTYTLQKDNEIAKQQILNKLSLPHPRRYLYIPISEYISDEEAYRSHTLYKEKNDHIDDFERQNSLLFKKSISSNKDRKERGLQYYMSKLQSQGSQEEVQ